MANEFDYATATLRNGGYVASDTQLKIRDQTLLIAGCGIGSSLAICAVRMGFEKFLLVDGDVVDAHNLNRQFYEFSDIGLPKVQALKSKILAINPTAEVKTWQQNLDADNTDSIVADAGIVFDTVDFLDLPAILKLHSSARGRNIPIFTALSVGFGALVWYFPAGSDMSLADILYPDFIAARGNVEGQPGYAAVFASFITRIAPYLDRNVVAQVGKVLEMMKEGKPCPASQVAVGSFAIGAMAMSMIHDVLAELPVPAAPQLLIHSFQSHKTTVVDVSSSLASQ